MTTNEISISVLLPTRGRTTALETSLITLIEHASCPDRVQILLGFDQDDTASQDYFVETIKPKLDKLNTNFTAMIFEPMGYIRLNEYVNKLALHASGEWLMFWNDDAIMESSGWDDKIRNWNGKFKVLRMPTHNFHPYAIFPIVPKLWYDLFGYLSDHQISDAWISQIGYMVDIMQDIDVKVTHDRHDLTGNNGDETFHRRPMLEGNPRNPRDFNHASWRARRMADARKIHQYLINTGENTGWFDAVLQGKKDPWEKMMSPACDPNKQLAKTDARY